MTLDLLSLAQRMPFWRETRRFLTGFAKDAYRNFENKQILLPSQVQKPPSPPLRFGNTTANHPPSANCGFTLIGDQKQTLYHSGLHQSRSKEGKKELENKVHNHFEAQEKLLKEQKESEVRKGAVESNIAPHNKPAGNLCRDTEKTLKRKSEPGQL